MNRTARIVSATFVVAALLSAAACGSDQDSPTATPASNPVPSVQVRAVVPASAAQFTVTTADATADRAFPADFYAGAFGCTAANHAPRLRWSGAPAAAKSFAVTMFDPDAPTAAGFWHWMNWDIPAAATDFTAGTAGVAGVNDAGVPGYLGPVSARRRPPAHVPDLRAGPGHRDPGPARGDHPDGRFVLDGFAHHRRGPAVADRAATLNRNAPGVPACPAGTPGGGTSVSPGAGGA